MEYFTFDRDTCCFCIQYVLETCSISYLYKKRASGPRLGRQCLQGDGDGSVCTWTNGSCAFPAAATFAERHCRAVLVPHVGHQGQAWSFDPPAPGCSSWRAWPRARAWRPDGKPLRGFGGPTGGGMGLNSKANNPNPRIMITDPQFAAIPRSTKT
jgi:hypothetical protein